MINQELSKGMLRWAMALVFLYFGISQLINPDMWTFFIPEWISNIIDAKTLVYMNGVFEVIFGTLLLLGLFTRLSSLLLALHLTGITLSVGFSETGVRDFGLTVATFAIFLNGTDKYCLDHKVRAKRKNKIF